MSDNPYLAHLEPHQRGTGSAEGGAPFDGWIARKIDGKQVEKAMVSASILQVMLFRGRRSSSSCCSVAEQKLSQACRSLPNNITDSSTFSLAQDGPTNPFTLRPHSKRYMDILTLRKNLPVHQQMSEFIEMFQSSQFTVMVGETGSGKTTQ